MNKGGCTDLRNIGPNSPVRVFSSTGKLVRIEKGTTIDDFVGKAVRMPISRRNEPPYAMLGKW